MYALSVVCLGMLTGLTVLLEWCAIALIALADMADSASAKLEKSSKILAEKLNQRYY